MRLHRFFLFATLFGVSGLLADDDGRKSYLFPPEGAPFPDAMGRVEIEDDELEIKVKGLGADASYGVYLDDGSGALTDVGAIDTNGDGEGKLEFEGAAVTDGSDGTDGTDGGGSVPDGDDDDGDDDGDDDDDELPLPFGVENADQLAGRAIEIRDADGNVVLAGLTPDLVFMDEEREGETQLMRPEPPVDDDAEGEIRLKQEGGRLQIRVKVRHLDPETVYSVSLTSPDGTTEALGDVTTNGGGNGQLRVDTGKGDSVPFGVGNLDDLIGFDVAVTDAEGNVVLKGTIEDVKTVPDDDDGDGDGDEDDEEEGEACLAATDAESGARGEVEIEIEGDGEQKFKVKVKGLAPASVFGVVVTAADGASASAGDITTNSRGRGELFLRDADALLLGVSSVGDLAGATVEVVDADGNAVLTGVVPTLGDEADCDMGDDDDDDDDDDGDDDEIEFKALLDGSQEVPPVESAGSGKAEFELEDGKLEFELDVADLVGVIQAHIHVGPAGENGPVVAFLFGPADPPIDVGDKTEIAEGDITDEDIIERPDIGFDGTLASLVEQMLAGNTYVNVHTEANRPGEIRGQIVVCVDDDDGDDGDDGSDGTDGGGGGVQLPVDDGFAVVGPFDAPFLRGDSNADLVVDVSDPIHTLVYLFVGGDNVERPVCFDAADSNDDGAVDVSDGITTLQFLFVGNVKLPPPGAVISGFDSTADTLFCEESL